MDIAALVSSKNSLKESYFCCLKLLQLGNLAKKGSILQFFNILSNYVGIHTYGEICTNSNFKLVMVKFAIKMIKYFLLKPLSYPTLRDASPSLSNSMTHIAFMISPCTCRLQPDSRGMYVL